VFSAQGTVASPCPVAGFSPQAEPLLMLTLNIRKPAAEVKLNFANDSRRGKSWASLERQLRSYDPDMIVSEWGDTVLFPGLLR
ncbi:MAG: hypothetical protein KGM47_16995, partial [Acidobacteriota bacterium]|nr:hypothetical protein [Acidobacteriota bacterium]